MKYICSALLPLLAAFGLLTSCMGNGRAMMNGGEVTGARGTAFNEPVPYGMVEVKRGFLKTTRSGEPQRPARRYRSTASGWTSRK